MEQSKVTLHNTDTVTGTARLRTLQPALAAACGLPVRASLLLHSRAIVRGGERGKTQTRHTDSGKKIFLLRGPRAHDTICVAPPYYAALPALRCQKLARWPRVPSWWLSAVPPKR